MRGASEDDARARELASESMRRVRARKAARRDIMNALVTVTTARAAEGASARAVLAGNGASTRSQQLAQAQHRADAYAEHLEQILVAAMRGASAEEIKHIVEAVCDRIVSAYVRRATR